MGLLMVHVSRISSSAGVLGQWTISAWTSASPKILSESESATTFFTSFLPSSSYAKFRPVRAREEDEDPLHGEIGLVVSAGNIPPSAAEGPAFSLEDDDETAAAAAAQRRRRRTSSACAPHAPGGGLSVLKSHFARSLGSETRGISTL